MAAVDRLAALLNDTREEERRRVETVKEELEAVRREIGEEEERKKEVEAKVRGGAGRGETLEVVQPWRLTRAVKHLSLSLSLSSPGRRTFSSRS